MTILILSLILQIAILISGFFYYDVVLAFDAPTFQLIKDIRYIFYIIAIVSILLTICCLFIYQNKTIAIVLFFLTFISLLTPFIIIQYQQNVNLQKRLEINNTKLESITSDIEQRLKIEEKMVSRQSPYSFVEASSLLELLVDIAYYVENYKLKKTYRKQIQQIIQTATENGILNPNIINPQDNQPLFMHFFIKHEPYSYVNRKEVLMMSYVLALFYNNGADKTLVDNQNRNIDDYLSILDHELK